MTAQTGRTVSRWVRFCVDDSSGTPREIPISSLSVVGFAYDEVDLTAYQDAVKGALPNHPDAPIEITGIWDNSALTTMAASANAPTLSGSHTLLSAIHGVGTPLNLCVLFGVRHYWESGEPSFIATATTTSGYICGTYTVDCNNMTYKAKFTFVPGSTAPVWGTTIIS